MASLADTINLSKQSGKLFETTSEASDSAGRDANPISPLGTKLLGTTPDQAKMAGTPANVGKAARDSMGISLRDVIRKEQAGTTKTEGEAAKAARVSQLGAFGIEMEDRVANLVQAKSLEAAGAKPVSVTVLPDALKTAFPAAANVNSLASNLEGVLNRRVPASDLPAKALEIARDLGITAPTGDSPKELDDFMRSVETTLSKAMPDVSKELQKGAAAALQDYANLTVSDLFAEGGTEAQGALGSPTELANALGVDVEALNKMSLPRLKQALDEAGQKDFSRIRELQARAADAYTSPSERNAIIRELRTLGASGVRTSEKDYQRYADAVKSGDRVDFQGKDMSLEEAMSDNAVSSWVYAYMTGDDNTRLTLGQENPGLAKFVESNKKALADASSSLSDSIRSEAKKTQDIIAVKNTVGFSDGAMEKLVPNYSKLGAAIPPETKAMLDNLAKMPRGLIDYVDTQINAGGNVADARFLLSQDPEILNKLSSNPAKLREWLTYQKTFDERMTSPEGALSLIGLTQDTANSALRDYWRDINTPGVADNPELRSIMQAIDKNRDGILDSDFNETLRGPLSNLIKSRAIGEGTFTDPSNLKGLQDTIHQSAESARTEISRAAQKANETKVQAYTADMDEVKRLQAQVADILSRQRTEGNASTRKIMDGELKVVRDKIVAILDKNSINSKGKDLDKYDWSKAPISGISMPSKGISIVPTAAPPPAAPPPPSAPKTAASPGKASPTKGGKGKGYAL